MTTCPQQDDTPVKTAAERLLALRARREALGLKRRDVYTHPDDWPTIKALAEKLQRRRAKSRSTPPFPPTDENLKP
jgi:hypothetical protein